MKNLGTVTLETERLILRKTRQNDAEPMFKNWANERFLPESTVFCGDCGFYLFLSRFLTPFSLPREGWGGVLFHLPPYIRNVGEDERHEQRDVEHYGECELAAAAVGNGEAALQVGG